MTINERFTSKYRVGTSTDCWLWTGGISHSGYGNFWYNGRSLSAHRASYQFNFGPIPEGKFVLHKCDVKICVNPMHLFLGTTDDNMADMVAKGRQAHGEKSHNWKGGITQDKEYWKKYNVEYLKKYYAKNKVSILAKQRESRLARKTAEI